jgi:hypothetical protein
MVYIIAQIILRPWSAIAVFTMHKFELARAKRYSKDFSQVFQTMLRLTVG